MMHGHEKSDPAIVAVKPANKAKKSTAVEALNAIKATTCLIDGEAVTCSEAGLADFDGLRNRRGDVHLCAFDLVEFDGRDLRLEPLTTRRRLLAWLIRKPRWELVLNALFEQDGPLVFEHACLLGCEGIVSKRKDSPYRSGRSRHWVKSKNPTAPAVKREAEEDWGKRNGDKLSLLAAVLLDQLANVIAALPVASSAFVPSGRFKLVTSPAATGSSAMTKTIGM